MAREYPNTENSTIIETDSSSDIRSSQLIRIPKQRVRPEREFPNDYFRTWIVKLSECSGCPPQPNPPAGSPPASQGCYTDGCDN